MSTSTYLHHHLNHHRKIHNNAPTSHIMVQGKGLKAHLKRAGKETGKHLKRAACQICRVTFWIICAPCLCCAMLCLPRRSCMHGRYHELVLPEVPAPRRRAMSLPLREAQEDQKTLDQPQSDFLTKLPLEIRRMVYERALGKKSIHLATLDGQPEARICMQRDCQCTHLVDRETANINFDVSLLRTCRQV